MDLKVNKKTQNFEKFFSDRKSKRIDFFVKIDKIIAMQLEELKGKIARYKQGLKELMQGPDPQAKREEIRALRKQLKRTQRKYRKLLPMSVEEKIKLHQYLLDNVNRQLSDLQKEGRKAQGDPWIHSLRKKIKTHNKILKRLTKIQEASKGAASTG